jgi:hypothetical protein
MALYIYIHIHIKAHGKNVFLVLLVACNSFKELYPSLKKDRIRYPNAGAKIIDLFPHKQIYLRGFFNKKIKHGDSALNM